MRRSIGFAYFAAVLAWLATAAQAQVISADRYWVYPSAASHQAAPNDDGKVISAYNAGGALTVTLPSTTALWSGWRLAVANDNGHTVTVQVNGTSGGHILYPTTGGGTSVTSFSTASGNYEIVDLQFDASGNFRIVSATPLTAAALGMGGGGGTGTVSGPPTTTSGDLAQWNNTLGTLLGAGLPVGGSGVNTVVETDSGGHIGNSLINGLPNSQLGTMAADSTKCNNTGSASTPLDCTVAQMVAMLGAVTGPGSSTSGYVPGWSGSTGLVLSTGYPVAGTGNNTIPETDSGGHLNGLIIPAPTASVLGGVDSLAAVAHKWIDAISTAGVPAATQPACSDLSGVAASCSTDATNAANISSGTLSTLRLPDHFEVNGTAPTAAANCGTGATVAGNDAVGRVGLGTGTLGAYCQITFAASWTNAPVCSVWDESTGQPLYPQPNTTSLALKAVTGTLNAGDNLAYSCKGYR